RGIGYNGRGSGSGGRSGASSKMAWALVPPIPNELTPARRGWSVRGHGRGALLTKKGLSAKLICGFGASKCKLGGICLCLSAKAVLVSPALPAALSKWPTFVLTEPIAQNWFLSVPARNA